MKALKKDQRSSPATRAFRDAERDILAAEGWFELSLEPEPRACVTWIASPTATA